jgi:hypothetical protein
MRPSPTDYPSFAETYIQKVSEVDPIAALKGSLDALNAQLIAIPEEAANATYAQGKWTVRQVFRHVIDTERIFAYRALCIARGDQQGLPSFDEGDYAREADATLSDLADLKDEFLLVRQSTVALFRSFSEYILHRSGTAGGGPVTVNALAYMMIGHWRHHAILLRDRYAINLPDVDV